MVDLPQRVVIFGAGSAAELTYEKVRDDVRVLAFLDNDAGKAGTTLCGLPVQGPSYLQEIEYDRVLICSMYYHDIKRQLLNELGVPDEKIEIRFDAYSSRPDAVLSPEDRRELQFIILDILDVIDSICSRHGLAYFLAEGSLLGAVRHQGFIPWDDDLDLIMPRADYDEFRRIFGYETHNHCRLLCELTYPSYHQPFTKIITLRNKGFVDVSAPFPDSFRGPYVDIFPLDRCSTVHDIRRHALIRRLRNMLFSKAISFAPKDAQEEADLHDNGYPAVPQHT